MFIRIKSTPNSPRKSVQIVQSIRKGDKVSQKIVRYIGIAQDEEELEGLKAIAESTKLKLEQGDQPLLISQEEYQKLKARKNKNIEEDDYKVDIRNLVEEERVIAGIHDIYGKLFDELNLASIFKAPKRNKGSLENFKNIVLARVSSPTSKRESVGLLKQDFGIRINLDSTYRMMDKLDDQAIEKLNEVVYSQTLGLFKNKKIDVVFFDCTTLYFESFTEDEFRKCGYSKDLKFNQPQVLIALMVTKDGLPIGYEAFSGETYEGHTLIPALKRLREKYNLDKVIYVADSGLLSKTNLEALEEPTDGSYDYIVGARLKNLPKKQRDQILDHGNYEEVEPGFKIGRFKISGSRTLIVSYSEKRAKKDSCDRQKAIEKLRIKLKTSSSPKSHLSNYGNKKYLKLSHDSDLKIELNQEKIEEAEKWDGLHGVITNVKSFSSQEILSHYKNLWQVEESFRITKHDLKVRPIYHYKESRVKAHLAISFAAYTLVRHLEHRIRLQYIKLSPKKIRNILLNIQDSILYDPSKRIRYSLPSQMSNDAKKIYKLMEVHRSSTPFILEKK